MKTVRILGIESSCDETAASVVEGQFRGSVRRPIEAFRFQVLSNVIASQIRIHAKTGGVVPEVAARAHVEAIIPVIQRALNHKSCILNPKTIDAVAVTYGPGLVTSLRVGLETARVLSSIWRVPLIAVNHLEGHIYAGFLDEEEHRLRFPVLALIVSGGHTELALMRRHLDYTIIGATRDDAAGEVFDKVAKLLDIGYPGGSAVSKWAERGRTEAIAFPRPMIDSDDFDFSFSGLKTAVLYEVRRRKTISRRAKADVCASFEQAAVDVLAEKTIRAAKKYQAKTILLGGGVAANRRLRKQLGKAIKYRLPITDYRLPAIAFTGDNAAMIGAAGAFRFVNKKFASGRTVEADPNLSL